MKIKVPAKTEEVCDICHGGGYLQTCKACGCRHCLICDYYLPGCIHKMDVCRKCCDRPEVKALAAKYAPEILRVLKKRDIELAQLSNVQDQPRAEKECES